MKTLKLKKMGMNFHATETAKSDILNYRARTENYDIQGKDGKKYFIEFCLWRDRKKARYTHKITGKELKHIKYDIINVQGVSVDIQYQDNNGTWGNIKLEKEINEKNYSYNTTDLLNIINSISCETYDKIIFIQ
jgi:hypothetical protein